MRLENLLALTYGKLINEPFVNSFVNIVFDAKNIKRGDLFIASDDDSIKTAIINGAYGIIFDKPTQISDNEIAWIKVNNIKDAIKRLLRFRLIEKEVIVYECDEITLKLALQVITETNFIALHSDIESMFNSLWGIDSKSTILFCPTLCDKDLFTNIKQLPRTAMKPITIMEKTLFETSFIYDDIFYERQLISPFFMPYLEELLHLFKSTNINFRLRKFTPIEHFEAVFTNKKFEIKEFGTSDKVLIFEKNSTLIEKEIIYLQKNASWAKLIFILPSQSVSTKYTDTENIFIYKNEKEILNILKEHNFHFALIVGVDKSILSNTIKRPVQLTLEF
jgi:ferrochelatase